MEFVNSLPKESRARISSCSISDWPGKRKPTEEERGRWEAKRYVWKDDRCGGQIKICFPICPLTVEDDIGVSLRRGRLMWLECYGEGCTTPLIRPNQDGVWKAKVSSAD